jgi:MFS family permease
MSGKAVNGVAKSALRFVTLIGVVNLFADMTYEGGRGEVGAFLGHLGANGAMIGVVAGGGELAGYAVRSIAGTIADRTGHYWIQAWSGYAINLLCVPALALAGSWPVAAGLVIGERFGRGVRRPVISAVISEAGRTLGGGRAFGLNEVLDQVGATIGPLIVAFAIARSSSFSIGFGVLIVPAVLALVLLAAASAAGRELTPRRDETATPLSKVPRTFWLYAVGGACIAAGYVDFALIAYRFERDHVVSLPLISVWFAVAMAVGGLSAPVFGRLFDRFGAMIVVVAVALGAATTPLAFLGSGIVAEIGAALWGIGTAVQDALLLALVSTVIQGTRKATAFGVYDTIFGIAWFAGSALCGWLVDRSMTGLVAFSVAMQLIAIPFFILPKLHDLRPAS